MTRSFRTGILVIDTAVLSAVWKNILSYIYELYICALLLPDNDMCSVNAINGGQEAVSINNNVATSEFEGTGPTSTNTVTAFTCRLDRTVNGNFMEVAGSEELCMAIPGILL